MTDPNRCVHRRDRDDRNDSRAVGSRVHPIVRGGQGHIAARLRARTLVVVIGSLLTGIIGIFIAVACAATLARAGAHIEDARDAAQALRPLAGQYASLLFGIGLAGAGLLAAAVVPLATAYSLSEAFGKTGDLDDAARAERFFYGSFVVLVGLCHDRLDSPPSVAGADLLLPAGERDFARPTSCAARPAQPRRPDRRKPRHPLGQVVSSGMARHSARCQLGARAGGGAACDVGNYTVAAKAPFRCPTSLHNGVKRHPYHRLAPPRPRSHPSSCLPHSLWKVSSANFTSKRVSEKSQQPAGTYFIGLRRAVFAAISCRFRTTEVALGRPP